MAPNDSILGRPLAVRSGPRAGVGLLAGMLLTLGLMIPTSGCYRYEGGNPVDRFHYEHFIAVAKDYSCLSIQTYVNRSPLEVGYKREDLYDGDRDGKLETPGADRVIITEYAHVEDPIEQAVRGRGEIRDYDDLFQKIIQAASEGHKKLVIDGRTYRFRILSENFLSSPGQPALG